MTVRRILEHKGSDIVTANPDKPIAALAQLFKSHRIGAVVVVDEKDTVLGMASERDVIYQFADRGERGLASGVVADIMSKPVQTCEPDDKLDSVMEKMTRHRVRHLPVVEGDRLIGIISIGDVINHRLEETKLEINVMREVARARPIR